MKNETVYVIEWSNGNTDVFSDRDEAVEWYKNDDDDTREHAANAGKSEDIEDATGPSDCVFWSGVAISRWRNAGR